MSSVGGSGWGFVPPFTLPLIDYFVRKRAAVVPPARSVTPAAPVPVEVPKSSIVSIAKGPGFEDDAKKSKRYQWGSESGSPIELRFKGAKDAFKGAKGSKAKCWQYDEATGEWVWPKQESGTYCTGFTLAVALKAAQERGLLEGKSMKQIGDLQQQWNGTTAESAEKQLVYAMETMGIGREVKNPAEAKEGDFVQIWRSTPKESGPHAGKVSGHSVVFLGWVEKDGQRVGIRYRTSNSPDGISDRTEYFKGHTGKDGSPQKGDVNPDKLFIGRLNDG